MSYLIRTIQDLMKWQYQYGGGFNLTTGSYFAKTDYPVLTNTSGFYNDVYGAYAWNNLNSEADAYAALPKYPHQRNGFRIISADAGTVGSEGVAEQGAVPDVIKHTQVEASAKPKACALTMGNSMQQEFLAQSGDDYSGSMEQVKAYLASRFTKGLNAQILTSAETTAGNNTESIDRYVSSNSESALWNAATDSDMYSNAYYRSNASGWYDAQVLHNSGDDRSLTEPLMRSLYGNILNAGGRPTVWLTGHDTYADIQGLFEPQGRYDLLREADTSIGFNGVNTESGVGVGLKVSTLYGIPLIRSQHVAKDTKSRVYLLDTSQQPGEPFPRLGIRTAMLPKMFEAGINSNNPFGINWLGNEAMMVSMQELIGVFPASSGKIRDLK